MTPSRVNGTVVGTGILQRMKQRYELDYDAEKSPTRWKGELREKPTFLNQGEQEKRVRRIIYGVEARTLVFTTLWPEIWGLR